MLSTADLAAYNFEGLSEGLLALSARRGLAHRQGVRLLKQEYAPLGPDDHIIKDKDFPEVEEGIAALDAESRLLAETASALSLVGRLLADQGSGPRAEDQAAEPPRGAHSPRPLSAQRFIANALAAMIGAPPVCHRPSSLDTRLQGRASDRGASSSSAHRPDAGGL